MDDLGDYVIYSESEEGYWSNKDGWGHLTTATVFTAEESETFDLPNPKDSEWVRLPGKPTVCAVSRGSTRWLYRCNSAKRPMRYTKPLYLSLDECPDCRGPVTDLKDR